MAGVGCSFARGGRLSTVALAIALCAGACATPLAPSERAAAQRALARLGSPPASLVAELALRVVAPSRDDALDAVLLYQAPGALRLIATKALGAADLPVLDLAIDPSTGSYAVDRPGLVGETPGSGSRSDDGPERGALVELPIHHPELAALYWAREALFLPGGADAAVVAFERDAGGGVLICATLSSGAHARWSIGADGAPASAEVRHPLGRLALRYADYRVIAGRAYPGRVVLTDPARRLEVTAVLARLEPTALDARAFELAPPGAR